MENQESFIAVKPSMDCSGLPDGSDDEDSFVVLETSSTISEKMPSSSMNGDVLPLFRTSKVREMQNLIKMEISQITSNSVPEMPAVVDPLDAVASSVAKITISPDSSYEEIQKQVEELIKENETLKNIIAQNNMSMKTQFDRFVRYRDEVTHVMKTYKEKLIEAKNCIDKFKEENAKLGGEVEVYINIKRLHEEEIIKLKERVRKQEDFSIGEILSEATASTNELQTEIANANQKTEELIAENVKLNSEVQNLKEKIEDLQTKLTEAVDNNKTLDEENKKLFSKVENMPKLQQDLSSKHQELKKLTEQLVHAPRLEEQVQTKQEEINVLQFDLSVLTKEVTKLRKENEDLKYKLCNASQESEQFVQSAKTAAHYEEELKLEIENVKKALQDAKNLSAVQMKENHKLRAQLKGLQEKYDSNLVEDYNQVKRQLSISQQTITALEAEREAKGQEIFQLRKLLEESENDEIFALKEQLTVYKSDFEAEKESKATLKREKDQIAEDLQNVQKRNKQLQNEIETLRARNEPPKAEGYKCPKCDFGFTTYQSLENHVHRCLDLEGFP
ncbi:hypothetical protein Zmor_001510 [Zophobas morio]|uniref:CCHC NOA-type domain-containing protein n=1 Tax=Zophobas morio TaxID=2755281 RepID=A0AA38J249_9CUCU|nr:hypothetical protein Zmor_001510 [Zophobas morio]